MPGLPKRGAHARVAAEIAAEQGIARQFVQAARRLLTVYVGILQELRCDPDAACDHVEVGRGGIVVDGDGILLHAPAGRGQAVIEIGVRARRQRRGDAGLQPGARPGQRLTDADRNFYAIGAGAITQPRRERLLEFALQKALLNDRLQGWRESSECPFGDILL